jgi:hypothetical protein
MPIASSRRGGARPGSGRREKVEKTPHDTEWRKVGLPRGVWEYIDTYWQGPRSTSSHALEALVADHYLFRPLGPGKARERGLGGRFVRGVGLYETFAMRRVRLVRSKKRRAS